MAVKHKNLYLYLTLACFLGIILIFIFDGYMGVYDTLTIETGEYPQTIEADQWAQQDRYEYMPSAGVEWGGTVDFSYEVDNRRFSSYTADVAVSVWHSQEKVADLITEAMLIASFDKSQIEWILDTSEFVPADIPAEQGYNLSVVIKRGEIERRVIIYLNPAAYPLKVVPVPR
jgi:hypothetical protein